ncbi:hypothetical protein C9374_012767 [Naegleria lovaniensis]|uniref:Cyclic nucleotide-binding domain-containing protein n=1 Tax=Naegleria lovaniensis TaxID=51637 RepID=A0AA88GCW6_NAELO|nr:uncharacterized protein C9374_012767 [Naegleria lovaniensis]KAG2373165.1 hypothetical protein C9374_012767 [Naegleria lovaniensis]
MSTNRKSSISLNPTSSILNTTTISNNTPRRSDVQNSNLFKIYDYSDQARHISMSTFYEGKPFSSSQAPSDTRGDHHYKAHTSISKMVGSFELLEQVEIDKKDWKDAIKSLQKRGEIRTDYDVALLVSLAKRLKFFSDPSLDLSSLDIEECMRFASCETLKINEVVCELEQNTRPAFFYVVLKGSVGILSSPYPTSYYSKMGLKSNQVMSAPPTDAVTSPRSGLSYKNICSLCSGDTFGEPFLNDIYAREGAWKWISNEETEILKIPHDVYTKTLRQKHENELKYRVKFLKTLVLPIFAGYKDSTLYELAKSFFVQHFPSRHTILRQGKEGKLMYFIKSGEVAVLKRLKYQENLGHKVLEYVKFVELCRLKPKEYFGERVLIYGGEAIEEEQCNNETECASSPKLRYTRLASVYTTSPTVLYCINRSSFTNFFNRDAVSRMQKYSSTYPKEKEIRKVFSQQQSWERFKSRLVEEIIEMPKESTLLTSPRKRKV